MTAEVVINLLLYKTLSFELFSNTFFNFDVKLRPWSCDAYLIAINAFLLL